MVDDTLIKAREASCLLDIAPQEYTKMDQGDSWTDKNSQIVKNRVREEKTSLYVGLQPSLLSSPAQIEHLVIAYLQI